jgi:D-alanine-D-alanine ligase
MENTTSLQGKTILLVNTGPIKKKFILQRLKKLGVYIVVLHKEKNWADPYVDKWIIADTFSHHESISAVNAFIKGHQKIKIDGVLTFWEDDVLLTSKIVDRFNLIGIPYAIAKQARNKFLFREFCEKNGLPFPQHRLVREHRDIHKVAKELKFPVVIKPAYGADSAYVMKAVDKDELLRTYDFIKENISATSEETSSLADGIEIFVEEYIDGDEVDIDILIQNGKIKFYSIADNANKNKGQFFLDSGQSLPSGLPPKDQKALIHMAEGVLEKLGIQNGCIHFEAKSTNNGPVPIEVNLRMGGDYVYSYIKGVWGVDLIENAVKIAVGYYIDYQKPESPQKYIVGWDLYPDSSGILAELDINKDLREKKYLEEINIYKEVGDSILLPPDGYELMGWITVSGDNLLDAKDNLKEALSLISYKAVKFNHESSLGKTARADRFSAAVLNTNLILQNAKFEKVRLISLENQRNLQIGVTGSSHDGEPDNMGSELQHSTESIIKTLRERGYRVRFFDFNNVSKAMSDLRRSDVDLVFNAYEQIDSHTGTKAQITAILEALGIPYTGSRSLDLGLCQDKIRFKKLLSFHNIPTPKWHYAYGLHDKISSDLRYPLIVKPGDVDNSIGITKESVVKNLKELEKQRKLIVNDLHCPALVEEYIPGDEYHVSILGNDKETVRVLPLARSIFKRMPKGYPHIYSYEAKWKQRKNSIYKKITVQCPPKNISPKLEALITEIALDTYNILHCQDYGRVGIRVDAEDNPYVIEVDPNPIFSLHNEMPRVAGLIGLSYGDLLEEIIGLAVRRYKKYENLD